MHRSKRRQRHYGSTRFRYRNFNQNPIRTTANPDSPNGEGLPENGHNKQKDQGDQHRSKRNHDDP